MILLQFPKLSKILSLFIEAIFVLHVNLIGNLVVTFLNKMSEQNFFKGSTRFFLRSSTRPWIIDQEVSNHQTFLNKPLICWQQKRSTRYFSFGLETTIAKSFSYPDIFDNHWTSCKFLLKTWIKWIDFWYVHEKFWGIFTLTFLKRLRK